MLTCTVHCCVATGVHCSLSNAQWDTDTEIGCYDGVYKRAETHSHLSPGQEQYLSSLLVSRTTGPPAFKASSYVFKPDKCIHMRLHVGCKMMVIDMPPQHWLIYILRVISVGLFDKLLLSLHHATSSYWKLEVKLRLSLIICRTVISMCTTCFGFRKQCVMSTNCVYVSGMILKINSDYFRKQH